MAVERQRSLSGGWQRAEWQIEVSKQAVFSSASLLKIFCSNTGLSGSVDVPACPFGPWREVGWLVGVKSWRQSFVLRIRSFCGWLRSGMELAGCGGS